VFQFTLAVVLLSGAGLMIRSFLLAQDEFRGVPADRILHARLILPLERYRDADRRRQFVDKLLPRLAALPGVEAVSMVSNLPGQGAAGVRFEIAGQPIAEPDHRPAAQSVAASPGYFSILGLSIQGRDFRDTDGLPGKEAIIISHLFAKRFFPKDSPIGQQVRFYSDDRQPKAWMTIIGVVPDLNQNNPGNLQQDPVVVVPYRTDAQSNMALLIRSARSPAALATAVRGEVQQLDGNLPLSFVESLEKQLDRGRWYLRVFGTLFLIFAVIAMGMAAVGIYAVIAHATARRTREIGIRLALGASPGTILRMALSRGLVQIGVGLTLGLTAAFFACRLMGNLLFKISPNDPLTFTIVPCTLLITGLAACLVPARRAAHLNPVEALRSE
jgi:putative ABC transport system permease protein